MIISGFDYKLSSPVREVVAQLAGCQSDSMGTTVRTYRPTDALKSIKVTRTGDSSKFFGFGVPQKLNFHLVDKDRAINDINTKFEFWLSFTTGEALKAPSGSMSYISAFPIFYVTEVHRDENTNEISVTAYDKLYQASKHTVSELNLGSSYTYRQFISACNNLMGFGMPYYQAVDNTIFDTEFINGANFEGTETIREALDAVAEATQTIYYLGGSTIVFKSLKRDGAADLIITKENYITLKTGTNRRLATIYRTTELGDDVFASTAASGSTQYVRDNPFWDVVEDLPATLESALATVGGLTINQFDCKWRGNFLLEIGDKLGLIDKDGTEVHSFLLDDVLTYNGGLTQETRWQYEQSELETAENPSSLGETIKKTYAKVDKVNKQIDLVVSEVGAQNDSISSLNMTLDSISGSVTNVEKLVTDSTKELDTELNELRKEVELTLTEEAVTIQIQTAMQNGASKVETATGFTFDESGLLVKKSGSEMETQITEDGMTVSKNDVVVLTANNAGVNARNLHAETYLIIGSNSRFEDYEKDGEARTGCFWIGG